MALRLQHSWLKVTVLGAVVSGAPVQADTVTLEPVKDNSLIQDAEGDLSNATSDGIFSGRTRGFFDNRVLRGLLAFDLEGSIPAGATITSARLTTYCALSASEAQTHSLHRVLADWGEGTSGTTGGSGSPSTAGDATWIHRFYPDIYWTNAGGDYVEASSATASIGIGGESSVWTDAQLQVDVQAWLDNPASNYGWMIIGNEIDLQTAKKIASREWGVAEQRPKLTIEFTPAPLCPGDVSPPPNGDGTVNIQDLLFVIANWGGGAGNRADVNGDNTVNISDLLAVIANWGAC